MERWDEEWERSLDAWLDAPDLWGEDESADSIEGQPVRGTTTDIAANLRDWVRQEWARAGQEPPGAVTLESNLPVGPAGVQAVPGRGKHQANVDVSFPALDGQTRLNVEFETRPGELRGAVQQHRQMMQVAQERHPELAPTRTTQSIFVQVSPTDPTRVRRILRATYAVRGGTVQQRVVPVRLPEGGLTVQEAYRRGYLTRPQAPAPARPAQSRALVRSPPARRGRSQFDAFLLR